MNQPFPYPNKLCKASNEAANKFTTETQHVALNADEEDGETIIKGIRGMAFGSGFDEGFNHAIVVLKKKGEFSAVGTLKKYSTDEV